MTIFHIVLVLSVFLCSLVAGFLFAFAIVVMPGIKKLKDREFIRAFQVTDSVIQNSQPIFILVWLGSVIALIVSAVYGIFSLSGVDLVLLILATLAYILGVQISTFAINIPLNKKIQTIDVETLNDAEIKTARKNFESRWNRSNESRALVASCVTILLIVLLLRQ